MTDEVSPDCARVRVYQSLLMPNRFWGCDRTLTMFLLLVTIAVPVLAPSPVTLAVSLVNLTAGLTMLRYLYTLDPLFRFTYPRYLTYSRRVYLAGGSRRRSA